jgi:recombination protein RecA
MPAVALSLPQPDAPAPTLTAPSLTALRTQLQAVVAGGRTAGTPWETGIAALDLALGGGIPRGRITEVVGALGVGKTALLRQVVARVLQTGGWVAWIDARRTLAAAPWAGMGDRLVVIRPHDHKRSAWSADLLLRSGVFALVVLDGAPALSRVHGVRLAQLARERDAACVVLQQDTRPSRVSGAVRLRLDQRSAQSRHAQKRQSTRGFVVVVEKGGPSSSSRNVRSIEVNSDIVMAHRVCTDSTIPDRRGVARSTRRPWAAVGGSVDDTIAQPVTWGGLAVSAGDDIHTPATQTGRTAGDTTRAGVRGTDGTAERYVPPLTPREREQERQRFDREFDKRTRDWTSYRGRRRAAESSFGKSGRRERARERVGAAIGSHGGQGGPRKGDSHQTNARDAYADARPTLGRIAEGVG